MQCTKKNVVSLIRGDENHVASATAWEAPDILSVVDQQSEEPELTEEEITLQRAYEEGLAKGLEEGRAQGFEQGKAEGFEAGNSEARQQVEEQGRQQQEAFGAQAEETLNGLNALVHALQNPLENQLDETVNRAIATLVHQVSTQVIKSELEINPEHIVTVVKELFQQLPMTDREVRFHLHPEDKALLESGLQLSSGAFQWRMESDEQIARGGCHVESHNFSVDETVEQRLEQSVRKVFGLSSEELAALNEEGQSEIEDDTVAEETESDVDSGDADEVSELDEHPDVEGDEAAEQALEAPETVAAEEVPSSMEAEQQPAETSAEAN